MLKIVPFYFTIYKFFNSLFLGLSVGAIFILYTPLDPSIYSLGGMVLAMSMLIVAQLYDYILNAYWFFRISLVVEVILLLAMLYFIYHSYSYQTALFLYIGYQITFVFGSYLVRSETLLLKNHTLLKNIDTAKQLGYLLGMGMSYLFYQILEYYDVNSFKEQVYRIHYVLIVVEIIIISILFKSFKKN
jgi:hypothetical protein